VSNNTAETGLGFPVVKRTDTQSSLPLANILANLKGRQPTFSF
jgi:hypothetical protein